MMSSPLYQALRNNVHVSRWLVCVFDILSGRKP
jgi:hypothetical protein